MLELQLALQGDQVKVKANGKESHQFSRVDLSQSREEWKAFFDNPRIYGEKLFNELFRDGSPARIEFDAISGQSERTIVLVLEAPELDGVAWEYAYNKAKEEYVVEDCAFVRALPENERPANGRLKASYERVPLLFIPANPLVDVSGEPMRALDEESEWREITKHITPSNAGFDLMKMLPATPEQLQTVMAQFREGLIVHFSGHGAATPAGDGAILLFERENGASNPLEAREFVREVKDKAAITFLSACQSAVAERTEFSNLARELVKAGVPFALGMQFNLPDPFAPDISGQFYNYLTRGHGAPEAARQARRAVKREHEFYVGMIALYAAHPDEVGALVWNDAGAKTLSMFRPADVSDLPSPASGLIGRQRELMRIGTQLLEDKKPLTVTLHGAGGIGKTAMLWQALLRFAPSFELTLAIALDPLPSLESVMGRIERFWGLPSPCSNDTKERETIVQNALTGKRTLLGLDNFETLNYALNETGSDEEKTAKSLHAFFRSLAANSVTLCVTSREVTNLPGETIEDIQGLSNDSGGRLFQENVVRKKDEIYIEKTHRVSEMVGGHPLALRLLASAFDDQVGTSLDEYIESLQSFLPKARDKWTEEDRHESLRASFDFTMKILLKTDKGKELQVALSRLSLCTAFFYPIFVASLIANKWVETEEERKKQYENAEKISRTLWEHGLLEYAIIPLENENFYLYRLHPALEIFARECLTDVEIVRENYRESMSQFAEIAEEQITRDPFIAQIALYAVPDLLALAEARNDEDAAIMRNRISTLLWRFGLYDDALRLQTETLKICETLNIPEVKATTLHIMANTYVARGELDEAMKLYQQSLDLKESLGDLQGKSSALHEIAGIYAERGDLDEAMKLYQQSLDIMEGLGDLQGKSTVLHNIAGIYFTRGELEEAMKLYQQSLGPKEGLGDLRSKGGTLHQIALIYARRGDLDEAMKLYQQSLDIMEGLGDLQGKSTVLHNIADIYFTRGDLDEAMKLYQQVLSIEERLGDPKGTSAALNNLAQIYFTHGDLDSAMKLYQQSLDIKEGLGDVQGMSVTRANMGAVLFRNKQYPTALKSLIEALITLERIGAQAYAQIVKNLLLEFRQSLGMKKFIELWKAEINQPLPDWLAQFPE
ncbi:MAG TPA: tetratricopeptide repeat protein [Candidatus Hydrogenedentes bacterium]|nr:tetratricopeptide repeat protein [Candidatus Hydrogenedentota bacterium]